MYKDIDLNTSKEFLRTQVEGFAKIMLFKGISSDNVICDYLISNLENTVRPSKTSDLNGNLYNLLLNHLDNWKAYPIREKSVIITNDSNIAKSFSTSKSKQHGKMFYVFPKTGSRMIISAHNDIWYSFRKGLSQIGLRGNNVDLLLFNKLFKEIFESCNIKDFDQDFIEFKKSFNSIINKEIVPVNNLTFESELLYNKIISLKIDGVKLLENIFDPVVNGFQFEEYNAKLRILNKSVELWTDSECLLVNVDKFDSLNILRC